MKIYNSTHNDGKSILVFGSNLAGVHDAGAALQAKAIWGARERFSFGHCGNSFAIPTKDKQIEPLPPEDIKAFVEHFLAYARQHPELTFLVTRIGCGLAGHPDADISPMFAKAPANCDLPDGWEVSRGIRCFACRVCNYEWEHASEDHTSCDTSFCPGCDAECEKCDSCPFAGVPCDAEGRLV
jgi:hypothetical protein